jgi:hypothetical protein
MNTKSVPAPVERLMEQLVALPSIAEQRAFYDSLSREDQQAMDDRGLRRLWRSRRASEAHQRRKEQRRAELEEFRRLSADERERQLAGWRMQREPYSPDWRMQREPGPRREQT